MNNMFSKLSLKEQVAFTTRLSFLIKADVPIIESLRMMHKQTKSRNRARILNKVIEDVSSGQYLSDSLAKFNNTFGEFAINLIRVGEEGGMLDQNLQYLAEELKKRQELKKKIIGALVYPIFVSLATLGVTGLVMVYVFPKIMPIFSSLGGQLPLTTRILIGLSNFLLNYGFYFMLGVIGLAFVNVVVYKKVKPFNRIVNRALLVIPVFGNLGKSYHMANFCRTLGLLLNSHVGIVSAANITANATTNIVYKEELHRLSTEISKGKKISDHVEGNTILFPEMVPQMIAIGETTGRLGDTLLYLSDHFEHEVNDLTKNLSSSIEPVMLVVMGVIVGFVAVSVISPIYAITQNIHP